MVGADHGPFILARQGLYARENGVRCFHLLFKGNDIHSGSSPSQPPLTAQQQAEIDLLISLVGPQNRVAYVSYPNTVASSRSASLSVSPSLGFWNLGATAPHKEHNRHFTDPNVSFLGPPPDQSQRLGVELILALFNALIHSGLTLDVDLDDLLTKISYPGKDGHRNYLTGFGNFHPVRDIQVINQWLGYWKWHVSNTLRYWIYITKEQLWTNRSLSTSTNISPALLGHQQIPVTGAPGVRSDSASTVVETVLRLFKAGKEVN